MVPKRRPWCSFVFVALSNATFTVPPAPFCDFYFFTYVYILPFRGLYSYLHHLRLLWVDDCCCPLFERYH